MWFYLVFGALLIVIGLAVHVFKWHFLISGYNTMSKEKKAKVNVLGLARVIGIYLYINGGLLMAVACLQLLGIRINLVPLIAFFVVATIYMIFKAQKYDGNIYDDKGVLLKGGGKKLAILAGALLLVLGFVAVVLFFSSQETEIVASDQGVDIQGMYGDLYTWDAITTITLEPTLPTIESRTNGSALGSKLKGHFRTKELGSLLLFVDAEVTPFIYIETTKGMIIINRSSEAETRDLYEEMLDKQ